MYEIWLLPVLVLSAAAVVYNYRLLYYAFFILIPFSVEVYLPNGLGTDLPTEPIMLALTGIGIVLAFVHFKTIDARYLKHPITIMLIVHVSWIAFTAMLSQNSMVSFKFLLAKLWYVIPFYGMTLYIMDTNEKLRRAWTYFTIALVISVGFVMVKYIPYDFQFKYIEKIMGPFFRNHVNYASIMAVAMPWMWALWRTSERKWKPAFLLAIVFIAVSIYYSYTRAAMLSVFIAVGVYFIIQLRLMKIVISGALIVAIVGSLFLLKENKWMDYAPDYEKTITHRDFNDLINATYKMEDISTMERVYRWVAAGHMIDERPLIGFGPGTFIFFYKSYTVSAFETYVSDNPQNSGIHSYYFMTWVDQGSLGLLIFIAFVAIILIMAEKTYHQLKRKQDRIFLLAAVLSIVILDAILLINDMLEVDKTGPFYFIAMAIIVRLSITGEKKLETRQ